MVEKQNPVRFEWSLANEAVHVGKHGIAFKVAANVFFDAKRIEREDMRKDYGERRWNTFGLVDGIYCNVTFTMRGSVAWIISARPAHRKERTIYDAQ